MPDAQPSNPPPDDAGPPPPAEPAPGERASKPTSFFDKVSEVLKSKTEPANLISDMRFLDEFGNLTSLRMFLLSEAVEIKVDDVHLLSFGKLNLLKYSEQGRLPTVDEWNDLDDRSRRLFSYLNEPLRKRYALSQTPKLIAWLPIVLVILALVSLVSAILAGYVFGSSPVFIIGVRFVSYLIWLLCLGAIGAIAFISMNALSIQNDVTFDLTNRRHLAVRIVLGALFGLVLSFPFGFGSFLDFCISVTQGGGSDLQAAPLPGAVGATTTGDDARDLITLEAALLLLPFILGFSTSLVILVLNRFVESISIFFGERHNAGATKTDGSRGTPAPAPR